MKKPFFRRRNALITARVFSLGTAALTLGLLLVVFRTVLPEAFLTVTAPVFRAGVSLSASVANVSNSFADVRALTSERDALIAQNVALSHENQTLAARVQDLVALVGTTSPQTHGVVAGVLARPPESPYDALLIDAGTSAGVVIGDYVLAQGGTPIGTVTAVSTHASRAVLFSTPEATTTAWAGTARIPIVLVGAGAGMFTARVPRQANVMTGDTVFVPGPGSVRPVGTVLRVDADPAAVMATLRIRPLVNVFSLTVVKVVQRQSL